MSSAIELNDNSEIAELEAKLAETERELERIREEYAKFAYIVSHDLSVPMRHIDGFTTLLLNENDGQFSEKSQQYFDYLRASAENAAAIMSGLLEYSRLNTRKKTIVNVDCDEILAAAECHLDRLLKEQSASITAGALPTVKGDREQLEKLFFHVFQNALLYHAPNSRPIVQIECRDTRDNWEFCFKDNGIGIKESRQRDVFDVLRKAVPTADYPGLGMGLAISSKIVQRHGGNSWIDSALGRGTAVYFTISKSL